MTLLSLCIKLYMLNVLQYSKFRPLCIAKNQTFPFITARPTVSSTISTLTTGANTGVVTTASTAGTTSAAGVTTSSTAGVTTISTATTAANAATTAANAATTTASTATTTANTGITNSPTISGPTTAVATTVINTRQQLRKFQKLTAKRGYEYPEPNCTIPIGYCPTNGSNSKCPCIDIRTSKINNQNRQGRSCIGPEKDLGICTTIINCTLLVEEYYAVLRKRPKISYEEFLALSKCRETDDKICCPTRR